MAIAAVSLSYMLIGTIILCSLGLIYDLLFSPLRHFKGPLIGRFTNFYRAVLTLGGKVDQHFQDWHRRWGHAVRVGPNAVSIADPDLIKVIYTTKNAWSKVSQGLS